MRNWLIGAVILFAVPAHAQNLITNGDFDSARNATMNVGIANTAEAAATGWFLYNNSNVTTYSEIVANFGGRSNLLHIVTGGTDSGATQLFSGTAFSGYADIFVVSGQARFGTYVNGWESLTSAFSTTTGVFERLTPTIDPAHPFNFVALYSFGGAAEFYVDTAFASAQPQTVEANAVPEPATWAMMLFGFGAMGGLLRARRRPSSRIRFAQ